MDKHPLHPYLATAMGLSAPPAEGTEQGMEPDPELAPPNTAPGDGAGLAAAGPDEALGAPPPDLGGDDVPPDAALAQALPGMDAPPVPDGVVPPDATAGADVGPVDGAPTPGVPDPNDPLRNTKDEGLYSANEQQIVEILSKLLAGKYALAVMYLHYGATLLTLSRDGIYAHFKEHAAEEQASAYLIAKKIVAMGGQAAPKVGTVRPVADLPGMFMELLKAEQKIQRLWGELNLAAGQNLGLQSLAQSQCELDMQHADDLRRYLRSG